MHNKKGKWKRCLAAVCLCLNWTPVQAATQEELAIQSEAVVLMDALSGTVLYEKNADEILYPASITKIMTVYLALTHGSADQLLTASASAIDSIDRQSSHIWLDYDEQLTLQDACYAAMMASANDASNVLAEAIGGSQQQFAEMMNQAAAEAGTRSTHFANAHGLPDPDHYTTAYDMAMITRMALENEAFREVFGAVTYEMAPTNKQPEVRYFASGNEMLKKGEYYYEYATGGKIGWTQDAGYTMVTTAEKDGITLIAVVMKAPSTKSRYVDTQTLFDYGFSHYKQITVPASSFEDKTVEIMKNGNLWAEASFHMNADFMILALSEDDPSQYTARIEIQNESDPETVTAFAILDKNGTEIARQAMEKELVMHDVSFAATGWPKIQQALDWISVIVFTLVMAAFAAAVAARLTSRKKKRRD